MAVEQVKKKPKVRFSTKMKNHSKKLSLLAFKRVTKKRIENDTAKENLNQPVRVDEENLDQVSHEYFSPTGAKVATHTNALENKLAETGAGWTVLADEDDKRLIVRQFQRNESSFFEKIGASTKFFQVIADDRPLCAECRKYMGMVLIPLNVKKRIGRMAWVCSNETEHVKRKKPIYIGRNELLSLSKEEQEIITKKESARMYYYKNRKKGVRTQRSIRKAWKRTDSDKEWIDVMVL